MSLCGSRGDAIRGLTSRGSAIDPTHANPAFNKEVKEDIKSPICPLKKRVRNVVKDFLSLYQFLFFRPRSTFPPSSHPPLPLPRVCLCNQNEVAAFRARSQATPLPIPCRNHFPFAQVLHSSKISDYQKDLQKPISMINVTIQMLLAWRLRRRTKKDALF